MSDYFGPVGIMGAGDWAVRTLDNAELRATGVLEFTPKGTALVWSDHGTPRLVLGLARGRWGSIVAEDDECED
jgi:hypothetical protein